MRTYTLYGTSDCHLCELALAMILEEPCSRKDVLIAEVDIANSDALFERYGIRIPVLQHPDGRELNWPFARSQLRDFLQT